MGRSNLAGQNHSNSAERADQSNPNDVKGISRALGATGKASKRQNTDIDLPGVPTLKDIRSTHGFDAKVALARQRREAIAKYLEESGSLKPVAAVASPLHVSDEQAAEVQAEIPPLVPAVENGRISGLWLLVPILFVGFVAAGIYWLNRDSIGRIAVAAVQPVVTDVGFAAPFGPGLADLGEADRPVLRGGDTRAEVFAHVRARTIPDVSAAITIKPEIEAGRTLLASADLDVGTPNSRFIKSVLAAETDFLGPQPMQEATISAAALARISVPSDWPIGQIANRPVAPVGLTQLASLAPPNLADLIVGNTANPTIEGESLGSLGPTLAALNVSPARLLVEGSSTNVPRTGLNNSNGRYLPSARIARADVRMDQLPSSMRFVLLQSPFPNIALATQNPAEPAGSYDFEIELGVEGRPAHSQTRPILLAAVGSPDGDILDSGRVWSSEANPIESLRPVLRRPAKPIDADIVNVSIFFPSRVARSDVDAKRAALIDTGYSTLVPKAVDVRISRDQIRFYHSRDALAAQALGEAIGATVRNFSSFRPRPAIGTIEVWLAGRGSGTVAARPGPSAEEALRSRLLELLRQR